MVAAKWADYVITRVRFNAAGTHIEQVRLYEDDGERLVNETTKTRSSVVAEIEAGYSYCTATEDRGGKWQKGAEVKVVTIQREKFIKTKADDIRRDNLDDLATF
jgi:Protein of unknown function (DUF3892)